jgi:hypothetical protein
MNPWSMPPEAFAFLVRRLAPNSTIVELGSGEGTAVLVEHFAKVYSVEHDKAYLGKHGSQYIHAPLVDDWYDPEAIRAGLPASYDCLIIDGPPAIAGRRPVVLEHLDLFTPGPVLIDDVQRSDGRDIAVAIANIWQAPLWSVHLLRGGRGFATLGWGAP